MEPHLPREQLPQQGGHHLDAQRRSPKPCAWSPISPENSFLSRGGITWTHNAGVPNLAHGAPSPPRTASSAGGASPGRTTQESQTLLMEPHLPREQLPQQGGHHLDAQRRSP